MEQVTKQINRTAKHLKGISRNKKAIVSLDKLPHIPGGVEGCVHTKRKPERPLAVTDPRLSTQRVKVGRDL